MKFRCIIPESVVIYFAVENDQEVWSLNRDDYDTWARKGYSGLAIVEYVRSLRLDPIEKEILRAFRTDVYSTHIDRPIAESLMNRDLVEWVPTIFGDNNQYRITEIGRRALELSEGE